MPHLFQESSLEWQVQCKLCVDKLMEPKNHAAMCITLQRAVILHFGAAVILTCLYWFSGDFLKVIGQTESIAVQGQVFARGLIPLLYAFAFCCPMQRFLQAQYIIIPLAFMAVGVLLLHALLSCPKCKETWTSFTSKAFIGIWSYFKITVASAVMLCTNYLNWDMQVMLGLGAAASMRISNELGATHPRRAKFSVLVVNGYSILISIVLSVIILIFRVGLSNLFTSDSEVIEAVYDLTPLLAISVLLNGIQPILSGVAIGSGWQALVAYVNLACYYVIGLTVGCVLGFKTSLGVAGIWRGRVILAQLVKLLSCDWKVTGSSPGNSLLCRKQGKAGYNTPIMVGPLPGHCVCGSFSVPGCPFVTLIILTARTNWGAEVEKAIVRVKRSVEDETLDQLPTYRGISLAVTFHSRHGRTL